MSGAAAQMPRYQSHKRVWALKIAAVDGHRITPADRGFAPVDCPAEMFARGTPKPGDYLVQYEGDGYRSFSPGKAFEEGYTALDDPHAPANERIARVCHEVNRAYCASLGDHSQPAWEEAPDWQRKSAMAGIGFTLANPDALPSHSHESWLTEKERDGWRYGPMKDPAKKEHPCFVPYDNLPPEQKAKDYLFQAVVRAMAG